METLFITFRWLDALDIFLVSLLIYQLYNLIKGTAAINIFLGLLSFYLLWLLVRALNMQLLGSILGQFIGVGVIALIIVFQQELRRFLLLIGTTGLFGRKRRRRSTSILPFNLGSTQPTKLDINALVRACQDMAETKTGAIIVLTRDSELKFYMNTGEKIDAKVTTRLLESIFFKNSPLHDGAIIISNNRVVAARCVLPVTENESFPIHLGMRHRAAVGVTENSDAIAIIVSEQTGDISYAREGELTYNVTPQKLSEMLEKEFGK